MYEAEGTLYDHVHDPVWEEVREAPRVGPRAGLLKNHIRAALRKQWERGWGCWGRPYHRAGLQPYLNVCFIGDGDGRCTDETKFLFSLSLFITFYPSHYISHLLCV